MAAPKQSRLPALDGLRGLSMLAILVAHIILVLPYDDAVRSSPTANLLMQILRQSVTLFFVLSGFLLYMQFARKVVRGDPPPALGRYIRHRILRIYPAHTVVFIIVALIVGTAVIVPCGNVPGCWQTQPVGRLTDPVTFVANLLLIQGWFPHTAFTGLSVSWTLVTEAGFYAALPFLGFVARMVARRYSVWVAVSVPGVLMLVVGAATRFALEGAWAQHHTGEIGFSRNWWGVIMHTLIGQADLFGAGMLAAVVVLAAGRSKRAQTVAGRLSWTVLGLGPIVLAGLLVAHVRSAAVADTVVAVAASGLIVLTQLPRGPITNAVVALCDSRFVHASGAQSYSLYLWHFPVLLWVRDHFEGFRYHSLLQLPLLYAVMLPVVWAFAYITYRFVELPAMRKAR